MEFSEFLGKESASQWDVAVVTEVFENRDLVSWTRSSGSKAKGFILAGLQGLLGFGFLYFVSEHVVQDFNRERCRMAFVSGIDRGAS